MAALMLLLAGLLSSCGHNKVDRPHVLNADEHLIRVEPGQPVTTQRPGYFVSDDLYAELLLKIQQLRAEIEELKAGPIGGLLWPKHADTKELSCIARIEPSAA